MDKLKKYGSVKDLKALTVNVNVNVKGNVNDL